jgi:DNA-binding NarL/FixJ family response regulator
VCIRVLIVDDKSRARSSLRALLTAMRWNTPSNIQQLATGGFNFFEVVGEAEDGLQAINQMEMLHPDVVVMDLQVPRLHGMAAIEDIKKRWPDVRIVVLTMYAKDRSSAFDAGADAFLLKGCPANELFDALGRKD